jgi:putative N6-adenine-specific DNA methylase
MSTQYLTFITVTPGLESVLQEELTDLLPGLNSKQRTGGFEARIPIESIWTVAHYSRTAEAIRVRIGRFEARTLDELQTGFSKIPWSAYFARKAAPQVRVSSRKSKLMHTGAIENQLWRAMGQRSTPCEELLLVRLSKDHVTVSVDVAGERMHRRGDGKHISRAPLRETLAAACLRLAGYDGKSPIWDPFCGSGTFLIEALSIAQNGPTQRRYAFEKWPTHDADGYEAWRTALPRPGLDLPKVYGSDTDKKAIQAARHNLKAFSDEGVILDCCDFEGAKVPADAWIIANPPYGKRVKVEATLANRIGQMLKYRHSTQPVHVLTSDPKWPHRTGLRWQALARFRNGGLGVTLWRLERKG